MLKKNMKKECPFCQGEMMCGEIRTSGWIGAYWWPDTLEGYQVGGIPTKKKICSCGGVLLEPNEPFYNVRHRPKTYYCPKCKILLGKAE